MSQQCAECNERKLEKAKVRNSYQMVPIDSLVPSDYNPNVLSPDQYAALVREVRAQGRLLKPIVVRNDGTATVIVDGHWNWLRRAGLRPRRRAGRVIEADEFEARRQTLIRNRHGNKDNLKLGRVYADMLAAHGLSYRELAEILEVSQGTVRNQLLYPMAWDLLSMHGQPPSTRPASRSSPRPTPSAAIVLSMP